MNRASIPVAQYKALAARFNPTQFSAAGIVGLAKSAGMKYIVITSKHHDGFAMFDSKANPFNIVQATPFKRDPLRNSQPSAAGRALNSVSITRRIRTGPRLAAQPTKRAITSPPTFHWDPAQNGSFATYLETKAIPQIRELLTNYGEFPAIVWFDTPTKDMTPELAGKIVTVLNQHPKLIWNNRLGGGYQGDTETPNNTFLLAVIPVVTGSRA